MNKEEIDQWLDNEYGVSYTSLEKIHDYLVDENRKQDEEIERLNNIINEYTKWLEAHLDEEFYWFKMYDKLQELKGIDENE